MNRRIFAAFILIFALAGTGRAAKGDEPIFPQVRALSLEQCRDLAIKRSPALALSLAKLAGARAELSEQEKRLKVTTQGGFDPFTGKIRFYLALDLERLLQLNKQERERARQNAQAEAIGVTQSNHFALRSVSAAWYGLRRAESGVVGAARLRDTSRALYVAADARFTAGQGELGGVLASLRSQSDAEDAFERARQDVALGCLDLAQSCGYATAEEMEAAL